VSENPVKWAQLAHPWLMTPPLPRSPHHRVIIDRAAYHGALAGADAEPRGLPLHRRCTLIGDLIAARDAPAPSDG